MRLLFYVAILSFCLSAIPEASSELKSKRLAEQKTGSNDSKERYSKHGAEKKYKKSKFDEEDSNGISAEELRWDGKGNKKNEEKNDKLKIARAVAKKFGTQPQETNDNTSSEKRKRKYDKSSEGNNPKRTLKEATRKKFLKKTVSEKNVSDDEDDSGEKEVSKRSMKSIRKKRLVSDEETETCIRDKRRSGSQCNKALKYSKHKQSKASEEEDDDDKYDNTTEETNESDKTDNSDEVSDDNEEDDDNDNTTEEDDDDGEDNTAEEDKDDDSIENSTNESDNDDDDSSEEIPVKREKKVTYIKKFAHEKRKREQDSEIGSILKIHKKGGADRNEKGTKSTIKKFGRKIDDDDESSEEDVFPKRLQLALDDDDDEE